MSRCFGRGFDSRLLHQSRFNESVLGGSPGFDRAHGSKMDDPLGGVTATKTIANDEVYDLPMAAYQREAGSGSPVNRRPIEFYTRRSK